MILDVHGGLMTDGHHVHLWHWADGNNQKWTFEPVTINYGFYHIRGFNSGYMDAGNGSQGNPVSLNNFNGNWNQMWNIVDIGNGDFEIISVDTGRVLGVQNSSAATGARVQILQGNNLNSQRWRITRNSDGTYFLSPRHAPDRYIDRRRGHLAIDPFYGDEFQKFHIEAMNMSS
jgi:hypothetical protein